ncbi:hypothetical protein FisN_10Hh226 [Fistulifera solaris]|uniref:PARP-type domain-containing protein n=1 Tax=Fistulifera solaris TaxID=1519565 RepID=A0A1Z5JX04_FISSO|nr:hypothetical protein FisN_10Hh226 [Fistulifera solaris]|eukprot:GAX18573.1 hypothetical protein FisN_10Hh226 [Fistulifera solaris]
MSSETTYAVEFAKTSRAKCKKCGEIIEKGEIKILTTTTGGRFDVTQSFHPKCYNLPRKFAGTVDDFVDETLRDATEGQILPKERDALVEAIKTSSAATKKSKASGSASSADAIIEKIKAKVDDGENEPQTKKAKSDDHYASNEFVAAYRVYQKEKNDELKDVLKWNRQFVSGTKNYLLVKVLDGHVNGRLARCQLCQGGKLKIDEKNCSVVLCNGQFDEDAQQRIPCTFQCSIEDAPRWKPWFTEEPSEEEKEKMDKLEADATGEGTDDSNGDLAGMKKEAASLEWNLSSKEGIRSATEDAIALLKKYNAKLPEDATKAKQKIGPVILAHKRETPEDIIATLWKEVGKQLSNEEKEQKDKALEKTTKVDANAKLVAAFQELSEYYSKEANQRAVFTYSKCLDAIRSLDYEITAENAMSLSKGKTKVEGIGAAFAQKIKEFCETGTIQKLEEKRADHA